MTPRFEAFAQVSPITGLPWVELVIREQGTHDLTPDEARDLADNLTDEADKAERAAQEQTHD